VRRENFGNLLAICWQTRQRPDKVVIGMAVEDNQFVQFFVQGWPVIVANPGIAILLLAIGAMGAWWLNRHIAKEHRDAVLVRHHASAAQLDTADRNNAMLERKLAELTQQHSDAISKLTRAESTILRLTAVTPLELPNDDITVALINQNIARFGALQQRVGAAKAYEIYRASPEYQERLRELAQRAAKEQPE